MARLIDEIRAQGRPKTHSLHPKVEEHLTKLYDALEDRALPFLVIDNVADYYYGESKDLDLRKDLPNLAPPYPAFWLEYPHREKRMTVGTLVRAGERPPDVDNPARWVLSIDRLFSKNGGPVMPIPATLWMHVGDTGEVVHMRHMGWTPDAHAGISEREIMGYIGPPLLAICFLHCKNVAVEDNRAPKPLAKKWHAKHNLWPSPYKTLIIEPLKKVLKQQRGAENTGLKQALHICRGHFKDYREGRGLFGKHHMLVWHDAVIRGTKRYDLDEGDTPAREIQIRLPEPGK